VRKNGERFYCSGVTTQLPPHVGGGFTKIARDLTEQRNAAEALQQAHASLERRVEERTRALQAEILERGAAQEAAAALLRRLVTSQEDERARIARDLHDHVGQRLTALRLSLERLSKETEDGQVARAMELAEALDEELGFLAWELRPAVLDDLGLEAALPRYVKEWREHYGVAAEYRSAGFRPGQLRAEAETAFYRIAQEALNNVAKHAHASRVDVLLESRDGSVLLLVEDDGIGFAPATLDESRRGFGLAGMKERAALIGATLQIESVSDKGTSVYLRCPIA
jgi:signal transduction histidine kinase